MPGEEQSDDLTLVGQAAGGDRQAFAQLVRRHQGGLFRYLMAMTQDRARAEDALQEGLVAAWKGLATFRGDSSVRAWLVVLTRHALARQFRRRAGEPTHFDDVAELHAVADLGGAAGFGDAALQGRVVERLQDRQRLLATLERLGPEDREIIWLADGLGMTNHEVAQALGVSLAAEKSRLHRARLQLLAVVAEDERGERRVSRSSDAKTEAPHD